MRGTATVAKGITIARELVAGANQYRPFGELHVGSISAKVERLQTVILLKGEIGTASDDFQLGWYREHISSLWGEIFCFCPLGVSSSFPRCHTMYARSKEGESIDE